jgi:hypothetical protein
LPVWPSIASRDGPTLRTVYPRAPEATIKRTPPAAARHRH